MTDESKPAENNPAEEERPESKSLMGEEIQGGPVAPPGDDGGVINPTPGSGEGHPGVAVDPGEEGSA